MATMEKTKQKKKKKVKPKEDDFDPFEILQQIDTIPSTSTFNQIPSVECAISSQIKSMTICEESSKGNEIIDEINTLDERNNIVLQEKVEEEIIQTNITALDIKEINFLPTAPAIEKTSIQPQILFRQDIKIAHYPDLKVMQEIENETKYELPLEKPKEIFLSPFSEIELNELYQNPQFKNAIEFENEFIQTELNANYAISNNVLYNKLLKYSNCRVALKKISIDLENLKKTSSNVKNLLWKKEKHTGSGTGYCCGNSYSEKTEYEITVLDENVLTDLSSIHKDIMIKTCHDYTRQTYAAEVYKTEIEQNLREILSSCSEFKDLWSTSPISLRETVDENIKNAITKLRISISILFAFLRRPIPDQIFLKNLKRWLQKLVAIQLRMAQWQDHMFLLYHILRCPNGTLSWTAPFIQIPKLIDNVSPYENSKINHCMTILATLLLPVKQRNDFLKSIIKDSLENVTDPINDDIWTLVDSDGEEGTTPTGEYIGLKESDLVALINQIPLESLLSIITLMKEVDGKYIFDANQFGSYNYVLKLLAFSNNFVKILGDGLITYNTERYRQFAKRIARLIRHIVLYVSDIYEVLRDCTSKNYSPVQNQRIQIEYSSFVLRTCNYIYNSRSLGTWQYLVDLPFSDLNIKTIWSLYYYLCTGFSENFLINLDENFLDKIESEQFLLKFNDIAIELPADDLYYLLQTFCNMILSREKEDWDFIKLATIRFFEIGFVNKTTAELCYKTIRDLLTNITTKYTELISDILFNLKISMNEVNSSGIYIFKALPLHKWYPTYDDFEIIAAWLLNFNIDSIESSIARTIISHLNWGFNSDDKLFLSHEVHVRMATLIAQVSTKHAPEIIGSYNLTESIRQVYSNPAPKSQFNSWCWNMVSRLRLHCMDQGKFFIQNCLRNPTEALRYIPEISHTQSIFEGVTESRPIALYLSILISLYGHSVPEICHKGFIQMQLLLTDNRHHSVIRCLHLVTPQFLECPESLYKNEKFQAILTTLIVSDKSYFKMAKDLIKNSSPGPIIELLGNMIQSQIMNYVNYGIASPTPFINLWIQCLVNNSITWYKDWNTTYIIDIILSVAYQFPDSRNWTKKYFTTIFKSFDKFKLNEGSNFSLFGITAQNYNVIIPADHVWLGILTFEVEHESFELLNGIWPELLRNLNNTNGRNCVDVALKKTSSLVGCATFSASSLVLYKLANFITLISTSHPLLPIVCQHFFHLYLARIPLTADEQRFSDNLGVANKFFDCNVNLMKKLKKSLIEVEEYYKTEALGERDEIILIMYNNCAKLFRTFILWLEETKLNKLNSDINDLPPQYDSQRLEKLFNENITDHWTEYLYLPVLRKKQMYLAQKWLKECHRLDSSEKNIKPPVRETEKSDPIERIKKRLSSYDKPLPPPGIQENTPILKKLPKNFQNLYKELNYNFSLINNYTNKFELTYKEIQCLDSYFKENIQQLYNTTSRIVHKNKRCRSEKCTQFVPIAINIQESKLQERVEAKLANNRDRYDILIDKQALQPPENVILAICQTNYYLYHLNHQYQTSENESLKNEIVSNVEACYYEIYLKHYLFQCSPTYNFYLKIITKLGNIIKYNQDIKLFKIMSARLDLLHVLIKSFDPMLLNSKNYLNMYSYIVDLYVNKKQFKMVLLILEKFNLKKWLEQYNPRLADISNLIQLIMKGLENWNINDSHAIQEQFLQHLLYIFDHNFPEHYGEVLEIIIKYTSEQKLKAGIILAIVNTLYKKADCECLQLSVETFKQKHRLVSFANNQRILSPQEITDTIELLARHYKSDRLHHGLHGLYTKHKIYCDEISLTLNTFVYSAIVSVIHTYPGELADKLLDWLWPMISDVYSPWLVPYEEQNLKGSTSNWIKHATSSEPIMLPCSNAQLNLCQNMLSMFLSCIQYSLEMLPGGTSLLGNVIYWYELYFAKPNLPKELFTLIHSGLITLPWERLNPSVGNMESFNRILLKFLPQCHIFIGYIILKTDWTIWLSRHINTWSYDMKQRLLSYLLMNIVKISCEPTLRESSSIKKILEDFCMYPWYILEFSAIEAVINWFVFSSEPSLILKLPSEHLAIDTAVLSLLQKACAIATKTDENNTSTQNQSKRILYVRTNVRLLRTCVSKYQKLLATPEGLKSFRTSVVELLTIIENISMELYQIENQEPINLLIEIVGSLTAQGENVTKLFVDSIIIWQNYANPGSTILSNTFNAIGSCKGLSFNLCSLLESTLINYFKKSDPNGHLHEPNWNSIIQRTGTIYPLVDELVLMQNNFLLCLHLFAVNRLKSIQNIGERITYLQKLHGLYENYKVSEINEGKLALILGLGIVCGLKIMETEYDSKKYLLTMARYFQVVSSQSEGWGEGLLGAIGLKKDGISNKRRILTRCFSCMIFSLFPDESLAMPDKRRCKEYECAMNELKNMIHIRKYSDTKQIGMIAITIIERPEKDLNNFKSNICEIIRTFYNDSFLHKIEEFWNF